MVVYTGELDWYAHRHTFATLQGIVNRDGPRLYLNTPFHYHPPVTQAWLDHCRATQGFEYEEVGDLDALIERFRGQVAGLVGFDRTRGPKMAKENKFFPTEEYLATSVGALTGMLPVPSDLRQALAARWRLPAPAEVELRDYHGRPTGVAIHGDLAAYGFANKAQAVEWAIRELLPHCSPDFLFNYDAWGVDYAVQHFALCTNLSYREADAGEGTTERQLLERILATYRDRRDKARPYFWVIGLQPPERLGVMSLSRFGGINTMTNMADNWSFHTQVPSARDQWRQQPRPEAPPDTPDTRYVAFLASECTTQKAAGNGLQHGAWLDPARGQVAINWGMSAAFGRDAPAVVDYYYSTATPQDYFFTGDICAGMGFAVPPLMPEAAWQAVLEDAAPLCQAMDLRCLDIYANDGYYDAQEDQPRFADLCDALDLLAVTAKNRVLSRGVWGEHGNVWGQATRVLGVIHYPRSQETLSRDAMMDFLFDRLAEGEGPWGRHFCCVYLPVAAHGYEPKGTTLWASPSGLVRLRERLDAEMGGKIRIVRLDELVARFAPGD